MIKTHYNYKWVDGRQVMVGLQGCRACQKRCKGCSWPFSASTAADEKNFCSIDCEDDYLKKLQK